MRAILALVAAAVVLAGAALWVVLGDMARKEAQTRLSSIPHALIRLALARVPGDLREDLAAEWRTELDFVLTGTEDLPLTALWRGIRFSVGLLGSSREIAAGLKGTPERSHAPSPWQFAIGLATAVIGVLGMPGLITEYLHHQIDVLQLSAAILMALSWALGGALMAAGNLLASAAVSLPLACAANIGFYIAKPGAFHLVNAIMFFIIFAGVAVWKARAYRENKILRLAWHYHGDMFPDCSDCASSDQPTAGWNAYRHIVRAAAVPKPGAV